MSNHVNSLLFTPFAGLLNLGKRFGVPESVLAPALKGAGVPEAVDLSKTIEDLTREACRPVKERAVKTLRPRRVRRVKR